MNSGQQTVVWEWEDELFSWRPYDPHVSNYIEQNHQKDPNSTFSLEDVEKNMRFYDIDLNRCVQYRKNTGTSRRIERHLYPADSPVAAGIVWQFEGDHPGSWQSYAHLFSEVLEKAYQSKTDKIDMSQNPPHMPYKISIKKMKQTRIETNKKRKIRRLDQRGVVRYLQDKSSGSHNPGAAMGASGGAVGPTPTSGAAAATGSGAYSFLPHSGISGIMGSLFGGIMNPTARSSGHPAHTFHGGMSGAYGGAQMMPSGASSAQEALSQADMPLRASYSNLIKKQASKHKSKDSEFDRIISSYMTVIKQPPKEEECCICMCELEEGSEYEKCNLVIKLKCAHMFHRACLKAMYDSGAKDESVQCPSCKAIYGIKRGTCPNGTMHYDTIQHSVPGHDGYQTIRVRYDIKEGVQGPEHPHPGKHYYTQGFPRVGYLPASPQGVKTLRLLIKAWERRLTFTVGQSVTTGAPDCVVWNNIHHKTEIMNSTGHGYPAPGFLDNVKMECAALGVYNSEDEAEEMETEEAQSEEKEAQSEEKEAQSKEKKEEAAALNAPATVEISSDEDTDL